MEDEEIKEKLRSAMKRKMQPDLWLPGSKDLAKASIQATHKPKTKLMKEIGIKAIVRRKRPYYGKKN
ncbi:hypothetical protein LMF89_15300 [Pelosinus sp. Bkl1]|uniref:Uncharacterized protein n=2 Tax=Pelosinus baikalensis TaxID=2892015 RepID=A0ABS8HX38_9FIRM|nr:hypothetical protein [Pelosinus baikalensis]